jgi:hypothetical protein
VGIVTRQASSASSGLSNGTSSTFEPSKTALASITTSTGAAGVILYDIGPYKCSRTLNLPFLASLVMDYIDQTSDTVSANLLFFQFNLHAAASSDRPMDPALSPSRPDLPSQTELVGDIFNVRTSPFLYQPSELLSQRANLNDSWYSLSSSEQPISEYFTTDHLSGGDQSTADGWPGEYFIELKRSNRILLGWGTVDPQMDGYNFAGDDDVIFSPTYISSPADVSADAAGRIESGCFYNAERTTMAQVNSSWAISVLNDTTSFGSRDGLWHLAGNLTSCGITPVLNLTLTNQTAGRDISPYVEFVESTVWNWALGEPRNASLPDAASQDDKDTAAQFRCALMETSATNNFSRWRVEHCNIRHRAACRIDKQPYVWQVSEESVPFSAAESACRAGSTFSVPRTGIENTYLSQHILSLSESSRSGLSGDGSGVWLNFNSLDIEACWVTTGPNGTCPHFVDEEALRKKTVLVPVIAALVVLLLTALTLFVKCNKNRRNNRKRIRGEVGWDYEGVPS